MEDSLLHRVGPWVTADWSSRWNHLREMIEGSRIEAVYFFQLGGYVSTPDAPVYAVEMAVLFQLDSKTQLVAEWATSGDSAGLSLSLYSGAGGFDRTSGEPVRVLFNGPLAPNRGTAVRALRAVVHSHSDDAPSLLGINLETDGPLQMLVVLGAPSTSGGYEYSPNTLLVFTDDSWRRDYRPLPTGLAQLN